MQLLSRRPPGVHDKVLAALIAKPDHLLPDHPLVRDEFSRLAVDRMKCTAAKVQLLGTTEKIRAFHKNTSGSNGLVYRTAECLVSVKACFRIRAESLFSVSTGQGAEARTL